VIQDHVSNGFNLFQISDVTCQTKYRNAQFLRHQIGASGGLSDGEIDQYWYRACCCQDFRVLGAKESCAAGYDANAVLDTEQITN
jgi:hypothetical protein